MNNQIKKVLMLILLSSSTLATSDDTDIINITVPVNSNILFVMDMSGSMKKELTTENDAALVEDSRAGVLHAALRTVLNHPSLSNINVGISSFAGDTILSQSNQRGHGIAYPITPIDNDAELRLDSNPSFEHRITAYDGETITSYLPLAGLRTSRGYIGDVVPTTWTPKGGTPIVDALYEAALYFRGAAVDWGKLDPSSKRSAHPSSYTGLMYNKMTDVPTPTSQICGGTTGIACNATMDSCPVSEVTTNCNIASTDIGDINSCTINAENNSYSCDASITVTGSTSCNLTTCSATFGCDVLNPTVTSAFDTTVDKVCNLASAFDCETANPTWDVGSCIAETIPEDTTPGACDSWNDAGFCNGHADDNVVLEHTVFNCKKTTTTAEATTYTCPTSNTTRTCRKDVVTCRHTISVDVPTPSLEGTAVYNSPITEECPNNSIILLSDGKPTLALSANKVASLVGGYADGCNAGSNAGRCGNELVKFLSSEDNNSSVTGDQFITTHTIGLSLGTSADSLEAKTYLENLAFNGGGQFINASSSDGLVAALLNTITSTARARSFSSSTYAVSASGMSHGDSVYVPVFDRSIGPVWKGNLKKYTRNNGRLVDADGVDATDPLGGLKVTARDHWSSAVSISAVNSGGAANKIPDPDDRKLYTDAGISSYPANITDNLEDGNSSISKTLLGSATMTDDYRDELIDFIRGEKPDESIRHHMGDILHSKPVYIDYGSEKLLFVGTNEGYLHALDEVTGVEQFAFMPSVLLKNIDIQLRNDALDTHAYGVDGPIRLRHDDLNGNSIVDGADKAYLYFGLRRGGKAYYALDVTDPASPKLAWKIDTTTTGFADLGYSWSKPVVTKMKHNAVSTAETVLVFGGGYVDDNGGEADDSGTGAVVYIVKASDGSLIWKSSDSSFTSLTNAGVAITHAVPGNIRTMDVDRNGALDRLYFADTSGKIWRVDFDGVLTGTDSKKAKLKLFADLGGTAPKRKFFTEPDVALFKNNGQYLISVAIGSGQRPKPLDTTTDDHFFVMFDENIISSPTSTTSTITRSDLKNATPGPVSNIFIDGKKGWYLDLIAIGAEKVLSRATTYKNMILFNSFGVTSVSASLCGADNVNQSRLYALDLMTGGAALDLDDSGTIVKTDPDDRSKKIADGEIPEEPQIIFDDPTNKDGDPCVAGVKDCTRKDGVVIGRAPSQVLPPSQKLRKAFWIDK